MIIGTAGHIDHGKTTLVRALTGVDTDRLAEEQARGMTIDLGFAYLPAPDGSVLGFVDMPGHEKFMRNMLAGATGIDLLLLVVAADDGEMPQTREHLAVAELLGIPRALVAITKCDAAGSARAAKVEQEVHGLLASGPFANAQILHVSAHGGDGIEQLRAYLFTASTDGRKADDRPVRFAIDRAFSLPGAGTVVTGVVVQGALAVGDVLALSPTGREVRVRSLHVQNRAADQGAAGQRCGVALGGRIAAQDIHRGDWLLAPELHQPINRFDGHLKLLGSEEAGLKHWTAVRLHHGAAEVPARVAVLQDGPLQPGAACFAQLVLDGSIAASVGDRFVIRAANGSRTLGGGRIVDLHPPHRRRKQPQRVAQLEAMELADPSASLTAQLERWPWFVDLDQFARDRALGAERMAGITRATQHELCAAGGHRYAFAPHVWQALVRDLLGEVGGFHQRLPRLLGPGLNRLYQATGLRLSSRVISAALDRLVREGRLVRESGVFRLPGHSLGLDRGDEQIWRRICPLLAGEARFRPPLLPQISATLALREFDCRRVLKLKAREGEVAEIGPDRFFAGDALREVAAIIADIAATAPDGQFGAADLRDRLDNGRKVAIELLEHFDRLRMTARRGDLRVAELDRLRRFAEGGTET